MIGLKIDGHVVIKDADTNEILVDQHNDIHYENMSIAIANAISDRGTGFITWMAFGNGASSVDNSGVITYLPPNTTGQGAGLYNQTYIKIVDDNNSGNTDIADNYEQVRHTTGNLYSDVYISCLLDYGEPTGQQAFDNTTNFNDTYTFDELGLYSVGVDNSIGLLLTHVVMSPVQKSLNRRLLFSYTIRFSTCSTLGSTS